jgi:hypothetical protein
VIYQRITPIFFRFLQHVSAVKKIPGATVLFGGELLPNNEHSIPSCYGSFQPTAIKVIYLGILG